MLIGLLALISMVGLHLAHVRAFFFFFIYAQLLIPFLAALWSGPVNSLCQLFIIIFANIFLVTRLVHWPLVQADPMLIPSFQYSWPNKKSRPESHTYVLFYPRLCVRHGHCSGHYLDDAVRSFFLAERSTPG